MTTPAGVSSRELEQIARLARLAPSDEECAELRDSLSAFLAYVTLLDEVDTSGVEATRHPVSPRCPLREDVVVPGSDRDEVLRQAPVSHDGGFSVPRVLEVDA